MSWQAPHWREEWQSVFCTNWLPGNFLLYIRASCYLWLVASCQRRRHGCCWFACRSTVSLESSARGIAVSLVQAQPDKPMNVEPDRRLDWWLVWVLLFLRDLASALKVPCLSRDAQAPPPGIVLCIGSVLHCFPWVCPVSPYSCNV